MKSFLTRLRQLTVTLIAAGALACVIAAPAMQTLILPQIGELKLQQSTQLSAKHAASAAATASTLIQWTRDRLWEPVRVRVNDSHPLVLAIKSGAVLSLTPEDTTLPVIWLSLDANPKARRALLQDRKTGSLTLNGLPSGASLDLGWLGL